jgi:peroxiredoxin
VRCRATAPEVAQVARQYLEENEDLAIVGIAALDSPESMQDFVDEFGITFPTIVDETASLWPRFDIALQGAWVFIDDDGTSERIPYDLSGELLAEQLDALLAR